jgi:hypothetical protein
MKNLKKLSRNELKFLVGGKLPVEDVEGSDCRSLCSFAPVNENGDDECYVYGLTCSLFLCSDTLVYRCV